MVTLVIEVIYYRRRDAQENSIQKITNVGPAPNITPPPSYEAGRMKKSLLFRRNSGDQVTMGDKFVPASISSISVYPRRPIHSSADENAYIE